MIELEQQRGNTLHVGKNPRSHITVILRGFLFKDRGHTFLSRRYSFYVKECPLLKRGMNLEMETLKFFGTPTLETERLILRKLEISDAQDVFEYAKHPEVARYLTWEAHKSVEDAKGFINWAIEKYKKDESGEWGIELKENGRIIGAMGFVHLDLQNSCGEIGYALSKEYWGMGVMTEAVSRLIRFGFQEMKLNRIEAVHFYGNEASGKVMQKAGMSFEGLLRQKMFVKGKFWDVKQYAIIKEEWILKKEGIK